MARGNRNYTDADKMEALQILEEKFNGNLSQCHDNLILKDGSKIPKRNLAGWRKKKAEIEASVKQISDTLEVVREDGSSIDLKEANRVRIVKHDHDILKSITEAETLLFSKLTEKLQNGELSDMALFKFGDMIRERFAMMSKEETPNGVVLNQQNNFFLDAKAEMKEKGILG